MQENSYSSHKGKTDLICLSLSRWDAPVSSPAISLCRELARTNRIFYIEHPFSWKDYIKENRQPRIRSRRKAFTHQREAYSHPPAYPDNFVTVTPPLVYPVNFLPPGKIYDGLSKQNDRILLNTVRKLIIDYGIREFLFINFYDPFFLRSLPGDLAPLQYIYQCMDDIAEESYTARHGIELEKEIFSKADKVLCTSTELARYASQYASNVFLHPNAADTRLFQRATGKQFTRPPDLPEGRPIIGFIGNIEYRMDFDLLRMVAKYHADKLIYMIGPVTGDYAEDAGIRFIPNIVIAGPRKMEELPAYLQYFDCCIIPYKKNKLTRSIYPLKINEYLSAGKPVVSTNFSVDIDSFSDNAYIAGSNEDFIQMINQAIKEDSEQLRASRVKASMENSWEKRAEQFWEIIG